MELFSELLERIAFNTTWKIRKHMLIVVGKSIHEEKLSQPLHINKKQFKIAVTFLTGHKDIFNVTTKTNKFISQQLLMMLLSHKSSFHQEFTNSSP